MNSQVVQSLHPLERKLLLEFERKKTKEISVDEVESTELDRIGIMRASEWLSKKNLVEEERNELNKYRLSERGHKAVNDGIPEKHLARTIAESGPLLVRDLLSTSQLSKEEYGFAFGFLKKNGQILIQKGEITLSSSGEEFLTQKTLLEEILETIKEQQEIYEEGFSKINSSILPDLIRRGLVTRNVHQKIAVILTEKGNKILPMIEEGLKTIDEINPEILISSEWEDINFRPYDIDAPVPPRIPGKRHYYRQVTDFIREIWLSMGFEEMTGPIIQPSFWNFDVLFVPQDHPARDQHDSFYMRQPKFGKLPSRKLVSAVKKAHETGGDTGSKGWRYKWSEEEAKKCVLRPHTTVLSARTLARLRNDEKPYPRKFFSLGRNFRNEKIDWKHLAEFDQTDGIVVDPDVTFRHHIGYLKTFFSRLGFPKARFRPGYFPYTEPSLEIDVFHPIRKEWVEFGGTGVFRPEVVKPLLGEDIPVLAWGPGLRMIMDHYDIDDMRRFYEPSLGFLRNAKLWLEV